MKPFRVLGIDPGIARTGYAIVEIQEPKTRAIAYGCIETPHNDLHATRLLTIERRVENILSRYKPILIGMERLYFSKNVKTAFAVGQAYGVILLAAARHRLTPVTISPQVVKQTVSGYGKAEKGQVQRMMRSLLRLPSLPKPDDVADALAIAYTTALTSSMQWRGH